LKYWGRGDLVLSNWSLAFLLTSTSEGLIPETLKVKLKLFL
jgi:hypothetical protein